MASDRQLVEVDRLLVVEPVQAEVVEDQEVGAEEAATPASPITPGAKPRHGERQPAPVRVLQLLLRCRGWQE